eukprot:65996-Chlamydomonas_euryale.AAC.1
MRLRPPAAWAAALLERGEMLRGGMSRWEAGVVRSAVALAAVDALLCADRAASRNGGGGGGGGGRDEVDHCDGDEINGVDGVADAWLERS